MRLNHPEAFDAATRIIREMVHARDMNSPLVADQIDEALKEVDAGLLATALAAITVAFATGFAKELDVDADAASFVQEFLLTLRGRLEE